jgi:pimeloyl-ACP methyl ester carboxylesterase
MLGRKAPYSIQLLANDTAGLLNALKIPKADVMGYSLGSYIAQQLTDGTGQGFAHKHVLCHGF